MLWLVVHGRVVKPHATARRRRLTCPQNLVQPLCDNAAAKTHLGRQVTRPETVTYTQKGGVKPSIKMHSRCVRLAYPVIRVSERRLDAA